MAAISDPASNQEPKQGRAASFYAQGTADREPYLERAREVSELTIPTLFREEGSNGSTELVIPWNSIGAYCVSNLASKIVFALFPAGRPNFKAEQDRKTQADLSQLPPDERAKIAQVIRQGLSKLEQDTAAAIEEDGDRARMFVAALRLLIGGNHAFQFYDDASIRGIPLERFVTARDAQGNLLEWAVMDTLDWRTLPTDVREAIMATGQTGPQPSARGKQPVTIYTHGYLKDDKWHVCQEAMGVVVTGSEMVYAKDALPYLFAPWILLDGEDYGRSYVEFYEGDLLTVESFTKTLGEGAQAMARFITLVNPVGMTDKKALAKARNGDFLTGREQDVYALTAPGKSADFATAKSEKDDAIQRLSRAFLLNSSIQRGGERVTAEEIRYVAQELEDALGGVYSQQIISWQAPYIKLKVKYLQKNRRVTPLPAGAIKITVTAGLAALARNQELSGLREMASIIQQTYGPQAVPSAMDPLEFASRVAAALGVDPVGLVPDPEAQAEQGQQAQTQQLIQSLGPEALRQLGTNATANQVAQTNADARLAVASQGAPPPAPAQ